MDSIIKKIVDMDEKTRALTQEAHEARKTSSQEVTAKIKEIREGYLARARKRIEINRETEQKFSDEQWTQIQEKFTEQKASLDKQFEENSKTWVDEIFSQVIGG